MYVSVTFLGLQRTKAQSDQIQIRFSKKTRVADVLAYIKKNDKYADRDWQLKLALTQEKRKELMERSPPFETS